VIELDKVTPFAWLNVTLPVTPIFPLRLGPGFRVNVLLPPVKVMALAGVTPSAANPPRIEPLLMIVRLLPVTPAPPAPPLPLLPFVL
jgi:hypothetical protein